MPKMKTKKAVAKRFKVTGSGKIRMLRHAKTNHQKYAKTAKVKRRLRKPSVIDPSNVKAIRRALGV